MRDVTDIPQHGLYREVALLVIALISLLLLTHPGFDSSEAGFHYAIAEQLIQHGDLSFSDTREGTYYVAPNGRTYAAHELGNTIFLLPVALLNHFLEIQLAPVMGPARVKMVTRFLFAAMGPILCAIGAAFLYLILRLIFGQSIQAATVGVLIFCFCSFYWTYSHIIFDGVLCSVLLAGGMFFLFRFGRDPRNEGLLMAAFACFGFGLITRLSMVLVLLAAGIYLLLMRMPSARLLRTCIIAVLTLVPFVCWQLYYNHLRTGNAFVSPVQTPQYAVNNGLGGNLPIGVAGLLFSPGKSVFVYCPVALLSLILLQRFWRVYRNEAVFCSVTSLLWLVLHAKLQSWAGAWGWGPRHFVTIVPVLALPFLAMRLGRVPRTFHVFAIVLLGWGFVLAAASNICNTHYRLGLAYSPDSPNDAFVWSPTKNQAIDAVLASGRNIARTIHGGVYEILPGASKIDIEASNTINIWFVTAHKLGVPSPYLATAVTVLLVCSCICLWVLCRRRTILPSDL